MNNRKVKYEVMYWIFKQQTAPTLHDSSNSIRLTEIGVDHLKLPLLI